MDVVDLLSAAYNPLIDLADDIDDVRGWRATRLPGWTARELFFHLASDAQRALVALATPADGSADTDEVSYWSHWQSGSEGADASRRSTRIIASAWTSVTGPAGLYAETARAVLVQATREDPRAVITTQGHRLTVESLLRTLAVEAGVHHLDFVDVLDAPPADVVLTEIRRTLDGLLGAAAPDDWDDVRYALVGTGRELLTIDESRAIGSLAARFPLFG